MTNAQFYFLLSPAIGSFVIIVLAWLHQNQRLSDLKESLVNQFAEVNRRLGLIEGDQKQFFTVTGKLDGRSEELSRK